MPQFKYKILHQDKNSKARVGQISTAHGVIETPSFVPVGTQATVKSLTPDELDKLGVTLFFVNTYHVYLRPGAEVITRAGGLHKFMNWNKPLITDSGGFQIFSLNNKRYISLVDSDSALINREKFTQKLSDRYTIKENNYSKEHPSLSELVKIDDDGVMFRSHWDGSLHRFTPELSIDIQHKLGADIILAFDECAPFPTTYQYAKKAMQRTHEWAERSLFKHQRLSLRKVRKEEKTRLESNEDFYMLNNGQTGLKQKFSPALFGVIQGSIFEDLRKQSAKFISHMEFDGVAIGGVSVGETKAQMRQVCDWVIPLLPKEKPRHLLGVGEIDDIFEIVERGVDTFDCVQPTRLARMGHLFTTKNTKSKSKKFTIDIFKKEWVKDFTPIDNHCECYTCKNFTKAYLHHLFRVRELLGYRLATIHNLHFFLTLVSKMREHIKAGTFVQFKQKFFS